jgi:hypothetical protein
MNGLEEPGEVDLLKFVMDEVSDSVCKSCAVVTLGDCVPGDIDGHDIGLANAAHDGLRDFTLLVKLDREKVEVFVVVANRGASL